MDTIRFATIGRSGITERFLDALSRVEGATHVAAYSRDLSDARAFADAHGAPLAFDSLDALAACTDVDAVYIATPDALHAPQALAMISGGKHVLVEKSFASNAREADEVFSAADEMDVVAMEAMRNIHGPGFSLVRDTLPRLGQVRQATFRFAKVTSRIARLRAGERLGVFDPRMSRGSVTDIGVYCANPAVALFGRPRRVLAAGITSEVPGCAPDDPHRTIDLAGEAILDYGSLLATLSWGKLSDEQLPSEIQGEAGTLTFGPTANPREVTLFEHEDKGMVFNVRGGEGRTFSLDLSANDMVFEVADFCSAVRGEADGRDLCDRHMRITLDALWVMDQIREQLGVTFPADEWPVV